MKTEQEIQALLLQAQIKQSTIAQNLQEAIAANDVQWIRGCAEAASDIKERINLLKEILQ